MDELNEREADARQAAKNAIHDYIGWETAQGLLSETPTGINSGLPFRDYRSFVLHVMFPPGDKDNDDYHLQLQPTSTAASRGGTLERTQGIRYFRFVTRFSCFDIIFIF